MDYGEYLVYGDNASFEEDCEGYLSHYCLWYEDVFDGFDYVFLYMWGVLNDYGGRSGE